MASTSGRTAALFAAIIALFVVIGGVAGEHLVRKLPRGAPRRVRLLPRVQPDLVLPLRPVRPLGIPREDRQAVGGAPAREDR